MILKDIIDIQKTETKNKQYIRILKILNSLNSSIYQFSNGRGTIISFIKTNGMYELCDLNYNCELMKNVNPKRKTILNNILEKHRIGYKINTSEVLGWCVSVYIDETIEDKQQLQSMRAFNDGFLYQFCENDNYPQFEQYKTSEGTYFAGERKSPESSVIMINFRNNKKIKVKTVDAFLKFMKKLIEVYRLDNTVVEAINQHIMHQTTDMLTLFSKNKSPNTQGQVTSCLADYFIYPENDFNKHNFMGNDVRINVYKELKQIVESTKSQAIFKIAETLVPQKLLDYTNVEDTNALLPIIDNFYNLTDSEIVAELHKINKSAVLYPTGLVPKLNNLFIETIKLTDYKRNDDIPTLLKKCFSPKQAESEIVVSAKTNTR